jgi:hypothetical protein
MIQPDTTDRKYNRNRLRTWIRTTNRAISYPACASDLAAQRYCGGAPSFGYCRRQMARLGNPFHARRTRGERRHLLVYIMASAF